jgi:YHS domain-containing protein
MPKRVGVGPHAQLRKEDFMSHLSRMLTPMLAIAALSLPASAQMRTGPVEALDGIDPVQLIQTGKEVQGKPEFKVLRGGFEYLFASADNKAAFEKAPEKYEIQMNGACARMGAGAGGNPSDYLVYDGKIYIFGSDDCHKRFAAAPARYLPRPPAPLPASAAAASQGRALLDRAIKALGGAERLDAMTTYAESYSQIQKRGADEVPVTFKVSWRFPDAVRQERSMTFQGKSMSAAQLLTKDGGWFISQGRAFPTRPEGLETLNLEVRREIVPVLRSRQAAGFKVVALDAATVDGVKVDRMRIVNGAIDVTVGVDPASGRIHSISFVDRGPEAAIGDVTVVYSDYRQVDGVLLPFATKATFDGAPDPTRTRTIDTIAINAPLDPKLFEPGPSGGQ